MGKARTIARRSFLVGSVALAGGVAFGTYVVHKPHDNPLAEQASEGEATFNPWVLVSSDAVTLIVPHADTGQGVASMQAALIAEELDIEFGQFETSFGVPSAAYYNTAMASEAVPFMPTDKGFAAETMRSAMGAAIKVLGAQVTGGSSSTPDSYEKLRAAGASARETLKLAASQRTGVPVEQLKTAGGAVQLPDGTELKYTELAADAATLDPVTDVPLRDPSTWRMVGRNMQRLDVVAKSTGTMTYGIDLYLDGMVNGTVRMNPRKGAALNSYDASAAEAMKGVRKVVPITNGVAVLADNTWTAFQAADAIEYDWAAAPYPAEQDGHWAEVAASFTEERLDSEWRNEGDVDAVMEGAETLELEYRAPYVAHQPLEPLSAVAKVTDDRVDVWATHQMPRFAVDKIAAITGHKTAQIHFHSQYGGGSFGHRLEFLNITATVEAANQMRGTPVKITFSREEDFAQDFTRQIGMSRSKGAVKDGKVVAHDLQIATVSSSRSQMGRLGQSVPGADSQIVAGAWEQPYAIPNFRVRGYAVPELAPTSSWRAVGASSGGFFSDCALDELIHAAGADPLEERLRLMNHDVSRKVLEAVGEMSGWGSDLGPNRGRGVAFVLSFGVPVAEVVEVTNTDSGIKIDKVWVAADVGRVIDPINFDNLMKGGVIWGLGHAMNSEITYSDGMAEQSNFYTHEGMRLAQCPEIFVKGLENGSAVKGIGEPPVPPAAPALANAIFAATGQRIREMPFNKHIDFV
ncbi:xanthine dehydrogenase family protein molybdopterin-binding subunit [Litoreibacter arenae]|uniref:Isoquinoline 1-oxidoreductase beta subunit n=1 Tax=Litoreibacter arenae DSM 19593 TaxID=1123360 RepID=S9QPX2_9RHOB|nr:molybdopterin cofactor-binding domain-containing protein [Litoreibacter arenae]EPX81643.1 Isoquinoline 1-oxidoreductase beta subunit [Litoreibacter arenae DSM 19593]